MDIQETIKELLDTNVIPSESVEYEQLKGGTLSEIYLLNSDGNQYVVKINDPQVTESEAKYLDYYKETTLLPKLLFVEPQNKYIVYSFIIGSTNYSRKNKTEILRTIAEGLLNNYKPAPTKFGWDGQTNQQILGRTF